MMFGVPINNTSPLNTSPFGGRSTPSSFGIGGNWQTIGSSTMTINEHDSPADKIASISSLCNAKSHEELRSEDYLNVKGTKRYPYATTRYEEEIKETKTPIILHSISAMPIYKNKTHEELRFEDYRERAKGVSGEPLNITHPQGSRPSPFAPFGIPSTNPFSPSTNPFAPQPQTPTATTTSTPSNSPGPFFKNPSKFTTTQPTNSPFSPSTNPFGPQPQTPTATTTSTPSNSPSPFFKNPSKFTTTQPTNSPFSPATNLFTPQPQTPTTGTTTTSPISPSPFPHKSTPFTTKTTQPTNIFPPFINPFAPKSQTPTNTTTPTPTPQPQPFITPNNSTPGTISEPIFHNNTTNIFDFRPSTTSPKPSALTTPFTTKTTQPTNIFPPFISPFAPKSQTPTNITTPTPTPQPQPFITPNNSNIGASTPGTISEPIFHNNTTNIFDFRPSTTSPNPSPLTNPFAPGSQPLYTPTGPAPTTTVNVLEPRTPALDISQPGQTCTTILGQPSQVITSIIQPEVVTSTVHGISSLPVKNNNSAPVRMSSLYRIRHLSSRRVSLPANRYNSESTVSKVPFFGDKEYKPCPVAKFIPRENPRAWVINKSSEPEHAPIDTYKEGETCENKAGTKSCLQVNENPVKVNNDTSLQEKLRLADDPLVSSLMPKLPCGGEYYTEPSIEELEAKERSEPGFCCRVKNFVVGRKDKGSIKFLEETDIRHLDLESIVQFNDREVIVYKDDENKPPIGQGLNRPAEVTLFNVKFRSKTSGKQFSDGHQVQKMAKMLMKKTNEQGAEFVSYNPVRGEWKFRVEHF